MKNEAARKMIISFLEKEGEINCTQLWKQFNKEVWSVFREERDKLISEGRIQVTKRQDSFNGRKAVYYELT